MPTPARKAHNPFHLRTGKRSYDGTTTEISVNSGAVGISLSMRLSHGRPGELASLTPTMARELARDLLERADELDPPKPSGLVRCKTHGNRRHHETLGCVEAVAV